MTTSKQATSYQKFSDEPATGIPVNSGDAYYNHPAHDNSHMPPPDVAPYHHHHGHVQAPGAWNSSLLDCFSDPKSCCLTFWCPCVTFGQVAEIVDKALHLSSCFSIMIHLTLVACGASGALYTLLALVTGCTCIYSCFYRSKMRQQYALEESPCNDFLVHCFCEPCALCQEYRELEGRGFNMSIGWHGNMDARNHEVAMGSVPPMMEGGMSRK